tara:strand:+ start:4231 stop:5307 length:1077 start_codon:yes stop_codon:yes gene_type:complete
MARTHLQDNDVLLNITGASIGRCAVVPKGFGPGNVNQHVCIIRVDRKTTEPQYVAAFLESKVGQEQISKRQSGLSREGLNFKQVRAVELPLPPLPEQKKIAEILGSVDEAIQKTQAVISQTERVKKGLLQELLTRGMPGRHTRFKKTEIGEIPADWEVVRLEDVAKVFNGKGRKSGGSWLRVFKTKHVYDGDLRLDQPEYVPDDIAADVPEWAYLRSGDTVTPNMAHATIGRISFVPRVEEKWACDAQVMVIRTLNPKVINSRYIYEVLSGHRGRTQILGREVGSIFGPARGQTHLYPKDVGSIEIALPPENEQSEIASMCEQFDSAIAVNKARLLPLGQIKRGLMNDLLTGKVRVKV